MYYPYSKNKGADQLREADMRLCFCICKLLVFLRSGSIVMTCTSMAQVREALIIFVRTRETRLEKRN